MKNKTKDIEGLYLEERKKARIYLFFVIILAILFFISVLANVKNSNKIEASLTQDSYQLAGQSSKGGGMGGVSMSDVASFFNEDESLDEYAVDEEFNQIPVEFNEKMMERFSYRIEMVISDGQISEEQGQELLDYLKTKG